MDTPLPPVENTIAIAPGHPRLFFDRAELARLRAWRFEGGHAWIWRNLAESADWCLAQKPRTAWIAPVVPDPIYLNLYDRFYAMMQDMAIMEHLAFAHAYSGDDRYFDAAREWVLAGARLWIREADGEADGQKAYAVLRLLKGLAVSYDLLHERLTEAERSELRGAITGIAAKYYQWYLQDANRGTVAQGPHHASVEAASFGLAALAVLNETPDAADWLDLMVKKHVESLLPSALAPSGAQVEGLTFYASTMQYRIMFLDALRRGTGQDLFADFAAQMSGRMALAKIVARRPPGWDAIHASVMMEPSYAQLNYYAPVLLGLARAYRRPIYQHLALWDETIGAIQKTRYITPHGEQMLFAWGGYAYAWYDPTLAPEIEKDLPLSFAFPEVNEACVRSSYLPGGLAAACRLGAVVVHAGGRPVLCETNSTDWPAPTSVRDLTLRDTGSNATISFRADNDPRFDAQTLELRRPRECVITRTGAAPMSWWCHGLPAQENNALRWPDGTELRVSAGRLLPLQPDGFREAPAVGYGKLKMADPRPLVFPLLKAEPDQGRLVIEIKAPTP